MAGGAPIGNKNATKTKPWQAALRHALEGKKNADKLRRIADKLIEMAEQGDLQAMKEIGDRLDGKPIQGIEGPGQGGTFTFTIVQEEKDVL